jgi:5-formyltetrahydrofolate cyclo-ligase
VTDDTGLRKAQWRADILAARRQLDDAARGSAAAGISRHGLTRWGSVRTVAAYVSVGSEPPTAELVDALADSGVRVLLPVVDGERLDWAPYGGPSGLTDGPLGLCEPATRRLGADALGAVDVVVIPALAVDRLGNRLGRGRGFYDRALADVVAPIVAVLYDAEIVEELPVDAHDRRVDTVLTPAGFTDVG